MTTEAARDFFGWCAIINFVILMVWFVSFTLAHDMIHRFHNKWFSLSKERFDALNYSGMLFFKLGIWLLNLAPYLALRIVA